MSESLSKLNIPKKISVGFQDRQGTYTGRLAYIIYTDEKGVLRKQKSWDSWRDHKIKPLELDNVPTSGFVLNKKAGGYKSHWNTRATYARCFDPRGYEFEVSIPNLLFILQETTATKGKGLEGEFVYAWDGTELVLLPVSSQEYQESSKFTELQAQKITKSDMVEGCVYTNKDTKQYMYLGRQDWYNINKKDHQEMYDPRVSDYYNSYYGRKREPYLVHNNESTITLKSEKRHVFVSIDGKSNYWTQTGFTKLANKLGDEISPLYAEEFEKFKNSRFASPVVGIKEKKLRIKDITGYSFNYYNTPFLKTENGYKYINISKSYDKEETFEVSKALLDSSFNVEEKSFMFKDKFKERKNGEESFSLLSKEEVKSLGAVTLHFETANGSLIPVSRYSSVIFETNNQTVEEIKQEELEESEI